MARTQRQIGVGATPHAIAVRAHVIETIEAAWKAKWPPPSAFYIDLMNHDTLAFAVEYLIPVGLSFIPHTTERMLPFRLSNFFKARPEGRENNACCVDSLRAQNTAEARRCLACIPGGLKWSCASHDERKLILAATFLRARAWGIAS